MLRGLGALLTGVFFVIILDVFGLMAQVVITSAIVGTATDPQNAIVPEASILKDIDNNLGCFA